MNIQNLTEELKRPATFIAAMFAFLSIILGAGISFYFYEKSIVEGRIDFSVQQVRIFDRDNADTKKNNVQTPLVLSDRNGIPVDDNVFAARIVIWNAGNGEIKNEGIRVPYRIELVGKVKVFSTDIISESEGSFDKFLVGDDNKLTWDHFDPGSAVALRVLYASQSQAEVRLTGVSAGLPNPQLISTEQARKPIADRFLENIPQWVKNILYVTMIVFVCATMIFMLVADAVEYYIKHKDDDRRVRNALKHLRFNMLSSALVPITVASIFLILAYLGSAPNIPLQ